MAQGYKDGTPYIPEPNSAMDQADFSEGHLECTVTKPQKENDGTKDAYISYLVTTDTDFKTFQKPHCTVRRRFTDFLFLYKSLCREYPASAVPPLPDKQRMEYVRGDRFGPDFTMRRCHSLHRYIRRLTRHPELRRAALLLLFLESHDWNVVMNGRQQGRTSMSSPGVVAAGESTTGVTGVLDTFTDSFLNAFTKVHKTDPRFVKVKERSDKFDDDLNHVGKIVARVGRRESDLETDYAELAGQFQRLVTLEPGVGGELTNFAAGAEQMSGEVRKLKEHTERDYLGSLKDMEAYVSSVRALLKTREQKQLDFEGLTDYLTKAAQDRDTLASQHGHAGLGASGFLRSKIEDVRGVDHEQSRRDRVRKLELQIERLTREVESAKLTSEMFDERVVKEVADFEAIKTAEFKETLSGLADAHIDFFKGTIGMWEQFVMDMEGDGERGGEGAAAA
ncbi:putative sorting nexin-4 [Eremomyces bilateralis CBS 781.70]|uniref:Sorting nexin-4 n=1 Tax=Eremomyces bilateralis CBS 781.70 TaxID=1392243 RepID=A0A6G1FSI1_9PEZI|nr:putative sorting nexin-4 [Eremomyces bilateralis CBS 781.70]KAF1808641.1 putative sorting nexin-4 [Eremomyces bilateralis CBS 781.70]